MPNKKNANLPLRRTSESEPSLSYDLDHPQIYSHTDAEVRVYGDVVIGSRHTLITKEAGGCFGVSVSTKKSDLDHARMDIVTITPAMLEAILKAR